MIEDGSYDVVVIDADVVVIDADVVVIDADVVVIDADVVVIDADADVAGTGKGAGVRLELAILAGDHRGELVTVVATGLHQDPIDLLGIPATLTVEGGRPKVRLEP